MTFTLLPAVDVVDGQAVRLNQGAAGTEKSYGSPLDAAKTWQNAGATWLHFVDLDAAFGRGSNHKLMADIIAQLDIHVELTGGIRDDATLERALATGAIWGKPTWGTFWTWDARLTSELILLFLYLAYMLLQASIEERDQADRLAAILAIVGVINIPIIHYSVLWWNSLHQGATLFRAGGPSIDGTMLWPLIVMLLAFYALFAVYILRGIGNLILETRIRRQLEGS